MFGRKKNRNKNKDKNKKTKKQKKYTILHKAIQQNKNERNLKTKQNKKQEKEMGEIFKAGKTGKQRMSSDKQRQDIKHSPSVGCCVGCVGCCVVAVTPEERKERRERSDCVYALHPTCPYSYG